MDNRFENIAIAKANRKIFIFRLFIINKCSNIHLKSKTGKNIEMFRFLKQTGKFDIPYVYY